MSTQTSLVVIAAARRWLGTPYRHQASTMGAGCDCLGLIRGVWREVLGPEPELPPVYSQMWGELGQDELLWQAALRHLQPVDHLAWQGGDVVHLRMCQGAVAKHLGILVQLHPEARFIHAYSGHGVVESALSAPWARRVVARFRFPEQG